jgi:hypothetical protein
VFSLARHGRDVAVLPELDEEATATATAGRRPNTSRRTEVFHDFKGLADFEPVAILRRAGNTAGGGAARIERMVIGSAEEVIRTDFRSEGQAQVVVGLSLFGVGWQRVGVRVRDVVIAERVIERQEAEGEAEVEFLVGIVELVGVVVAGDSRIPLEALAAAFPAEVTSYSRPCLTLAPHTPM